MDGLDCLSRLMVEAPRPVVMVSSLIRDGAETTLKALKLGAVDFVAKPDGMVSLGIERIRPVLVEKVRAAAGARLRQSFRLRERVRHRIGGQPARPAPLSAWRRSVPAAPGPAAAPAREPLTAAAPVPGLLVIGASTGGPSALETVLSALPGDFPWPILVAQHMPSGFTGAFARRLDAVCALRVVEVDAPMPIRPGTAYVGRGDADLIVGWRGAGPVAVSAPSSTAFPWHPSVDRLVTSARSHFEPTRILGVLMTGMGRDGAESMAALRAQGGRTIAEDEATAIVWGMPGELVRLGGADTVVPLPDIARAILRLMT
jgi:two-component system chemotaxis response regulator CheB